MISAVIPARNAANTLAASIASLRGGGVEDIILVDGQSQDNTLEIARREGATILRHKPCRGGQLAAGARAAKGDWLLFLHADTRLEKGWEKEIADFMQRNRGRAGFFRFALAGKKSRRANMLAAAVNWRCQWLALPYGDQGLLVQRALYEKIGGFKNWPLMEDVDIVRRLGRQRLHPFAAAAFTAASRYQNGYARRIVRNVICLALYFARVPPQYIARLYG